MGVIKGDTKSLRCGSYKATIEAIAPTKVVSIGSVQSQNLGSISGASPTNGGNFPRRLRDRPPVNLCGFGGRMYRLYDMRVDGEGLRHACDEASL